MSHFLLTVSSSSTLHSLVWMLIFVIVFHQPEELPLTCLAVVVCEQQILSYFVCFYFTLIIEDYFLQVQKFFSTVKMSLHCLLASDEKLGHYSLSSLNVMHFFLATFKIFDILLMICLSLVFIVFSLLWFCRASCNGWFKDFSSMEIFSYSFFKYFSAASPLFSTTTVPSACMLNSMIDLETQVTEALCFFQPYFSLYFILECPYCFAFEFTDLQFLEFFNPSSEFFLFQVLCFSDLEVSFGSTCSFHYFSYILIFL